MATDYENYQESASWHDPMALALGIYGKQIQVAIFDSEGGCTSIITGNLLSIDSEHATLSTIQEGGSYLSMWGFRAELLLTGMRDQRIEVPLGTRTLWKELP